MRKVLICSPRFPPTNAADMHRVRQSLPYFCDYGWQPTVLAAEPQYCEIPLDPLLEVSVPQKVRVKRVAALDVRKARRVGLANFDLRVLPFMARAGERLLSEEQFDLVYFSTTAFNLLSLAPYWKARFKVPYVIDLQDPWLSDYYQRPGSPLPPGGRLKYGVSQLLARLLEPLTLRHATHIISVSPAYPKMLMARYKWMKAENFTVLSFGAPQADFILLRRESISQTIFDPTDGYRHWIYVGVVGEIMHLALRAFFTALQQARRTTTDYKDLRLHFIGTDYATDHRARKTVEPIAQACGVADLVEEHPQRIPYFEALQCLLDADALIVPGSDDPGYTASKLYPYILAQKPMLAIFHEESSVNDVLHCTKAGVAISFATGEDPAALAQRIEQAWFTPQAWKTVPNTDWNAFAPYTAQEMTRRQCEVFEKAIKTQKNSGPNL
ncbi:hypothetical protein BH10CHL1_BH10CHL1_45790 [soil metagenome]